MRGKVSDKTPDPSKFITKFQSALMRGKVSDLKEIEVADVPSGFQSALMRGKVSDRAIWFLKRKH